MTATATKPRKAVRTWTAQLPRELALKVLRKKANLAGEHEPAIRRLQAAVAGQPSGYTFTFSRRLVDDVHQLAAEHKNSKDFRSLLALIAKTSFKPRQVTTPTVDDLVPPGFEEVKSGCLWCPLLPWSVDFDDLKKSYRRGSEKILGKEKDGHTVRTRCVTEEWDEVDVLFVGEAPGKVEDSERWGTPFVGKSGQMLRRAIEHAVPDARIGFSNIVACRPPRNREPNNTEVQSCSPRLLREIEMRKPKVVVALGNSSLEFLAGQRGITTFTSKVLDCIRPEFPDLKIVACLHPAYVLRFDHELDRFVDALEVAASVLLGEYVPKMGVGEYFVVDRADDAVELLEALAKSETPVSFDTETGSLSPFQSRFPKLLCFSFSDEEGVGYTIPWDHAESTFRKGSKKRKRVERALIGFFTSQVQKIAQNPSFDAKHIFEALGVWVQNVFDTMTAHFCTDERRGTHGLKQLAYAFTGMGGYEKPLEDYIGQQENRDANPDNGGSYANIPGRILFVYAAMDADVTLRVRNGLLTESELTENENFWKLATEFYPAFNQTLAEVEHNGAQVDPEMVRFLDGRYTRRMAQLTTKIQRLKTVRLFERDRLRKAEKTEDKAKIAKAHEPFNPGSHEQLQQILFGYYGLKPIEMTDGGFSKLVHRYQTRVESWQKATPGRRGGRKPDFKSIVAGAIKGQEWEYFSTKADVLHEFERQGNELCAPILEYRGYETLHGTFVKPLLTNLDQFDRVHGTYLAHGTVTARLASRDPNLQNIPNKGGKLIKRCYVSRFGTEGVLLQLDYSQIELRVAACWFDEPEMIRAYLNGEDLHHLTALSISGLDEDQFSALHKDLQTQWRTRAKRVNFGVLYGGGPPALVLTLRKDGVFITEDEARRLIDAYYEARPGLKKGLDKLMRQVQRDGYLESFTGHRRRVPEVFSGDEQIVARALRQSINFPIQCGAAQMTNMALILLHREMKRLGMRSKIILTVHDSLVIDCHVDEMFEVARLGKEIMETIHERSDQVLPGLDWSWLRVPLVADIESGFTWGTMTEWKESKVEKQTRIITLDDLDVDYLWAAMEQADAIAA